MSETGPVGRAVVTEVWGSAPRRPGACLLVDGDGNMSGSVSGGCVEVDASQAVLAAMAEGTSRWISYGVSNEMAWDVGLACGGTIRVLVEPRVRPEIVTAAERDPGAAIITVVDGLDIIGGSLLFEEQVADGKVLPPAGQPSPDKETLSFFERNHDYLATVGAEAMSSGDSGQISVPGSESVTLFCESLARKPRLIIFGGVHIAACLVQLAKVMGFYTIVADGREKFLTRERFPEADELILGWPDEVFQKTGLDYATYLVVLSHDPKFDDPAAALALRSPVRYLGVIGSRKTQQARRGRLREQGFSEEDLGRIRGPVGLDLGGSDPAEIALSIMAEIVMERHGRATRGGKE